jgi:hypothetical protein
MILGMARFQTARLIEAQQLFSVCLETFRNLDDQRAIAWATEWLARVWVALGELDQARNAIAAVVEVRSSTGECSREHLEFLEFSRPWCEEIDLQTVVEQETTRVRVQLEKS